MLFRYFVEASEEIIAKDFVEKSLQLIEENIIRKEYQKIVPYWKMEEIYLVEVLIEMNNKDDKLLFLLDSIADNWIKFGNPIEELVASQENPDCQFMRKEFAMVNIFL